MIKILRTSLIIVILTCLPHTAIRADEFTRSFDFEAIRIQRDQLLKIATEIFQHVRQINGKVTPFSAYIELGRDDFSTKLNFPLKQSDFDKFPDISYSGNIQISYSDGIITGVDFRLSNFSRKLVVTGTNLDYVIGLIKLVQEKVSLDETYFGGERFVIVFVFFFIVIWFLIYVLLMTNPKFLPNPTAPAITILVIMIFTPFLIIILLPWGKIFPGFLVWSQGNSFFLERYASLFTFGSFLIAVLLLLPASLRLLKRVEQNKVDSNIESKPE